MTRFKCKIFISIWKRKPPHMFCHKDRKFPLFQCLSVPFINKDASSDSSFRKMSVKYLCCPHKVIPFQKYRDFLWRKHKMCLKTLQAKIRNVICVLPFPKHQTWSDGWAERTCMGMRSWTREEAPRKISQLHPRKLPLPDLEDTRETSS